MVEFCELEWLPWRSSNARQERMERRGRGAPMEESQQGMDDEADRCKIFQLSCHDRSEVTEIGS